MISALLVCAMVLCCAIHLETRGISPNFRILVCSTLMVELILLLI